MTLSRRSLLSATLLNAAALAGCTATGQRPNPPAAASTGRAPTGRDWSGFGDLLSARAAAGQFSGAVLVERGGRTLLRRAYGMADRAHGVANTVDTRFDICSTGKMFTAVAVAQLVGQQRLAFTDTIAEYVREYGFPPDIADRVTIHQLLTHTSGMGDALARTPTSTPPTTLAGLMAVIAKTPLQFAPGTGMSYSNSGFIVLGAVIETVTGTPYADHMRASVFRPAGMIDTDIRVFTPTRIPHMAHPYALVGGGTRDRAGARSPGGRGAAPSGTLRDGGDQVHVGNPSGGAYSTVTDMVRFAQALTGHRLLSPRLTDVVTTGKVRATGPGRPAEDRYAYGFDDTRVNGVRVIGHNGGSPGYEAKLDIYPDDGYAVAVLTNQDGVMAGAVRRSEQIITG